MARQGNNPKRRVVPISELKCSDIDKLLSTVKYVGSGHHKRYPLDYGFVRTNPVPTKSLCDLNKAIKLDEAQFLLEAGIKCGMISDMRQGLPKYIWSVDANGTVYEAKTHPNTHGEYHGYPLGNDDAVHKYILNEWKTRCP